MTEHLIVTVTHRRHEPGEVVHVSEEARELLVRAGWTPPSAPPDGPAPSVAAVTLTYPSASITIDTRARVDAALGEAAARIEARGVRPERLAYLRRVAA